MDNIANVISVAGSEEEEGEEDEESSSSSPPLEEQLSNFRQQWKEELMSTKDGEGQVAHGRGRRRRKSSSLGENSSSLEDKAYSLFMQGVHAERDGLMFEAIKFYRQAVQLVPDIENKIQNITGFEDYESEEDSEGSVYEGDEDDSINQLSSQLSEMNINSIRVSCEKEFPQKGKHISALPIELLLLVFRWVVASHLDLRSLEQLSMVCRGFYVCARDVEIWRLVCQRIWGRGVYLTKDYPAWRQMFLERPHLRFDGVYICRTTYFRQGEQSFIDQFYRPWHIVEYYRYIRVFPDGVIMMLTSPEQPKDVVSKLRWKSASVEGILKGHYRLVDNILSGVLQREKPKDSEGSYQRFKRRNRNNNVSGVKEQTFHVEFNLTGPGRCNNTKLEWLHYSCETWYSASTVASVSEFDLSSFHPLIFSRVKSYTRAAVLPL